MKWKKKKRVVGHKLEDTAKVGIRSRDVSLIRPFL